MVNKKIVIVCTVITLIIVSLIVGFKIKKFQQIDYVAEELNVHNTSIIQNQNTDNNNNVATVENEVQQESIEKENEIYTENIINEVTKEEVQGEEETKSEEENVNRDTKQSNENDSDKALKLVQEEWGKDDTVYYTIDNQSNKIYNISVRSKSTTEAFAEYEVDVENGTVMIK